MTAGKTRDFMKAEKYMIPAMEMIKKGARDIVLRLEGTSMMPLLKRGDRVILKAANAEQLRRGELIAYREGGNIIVHRFIRKKRIDDKWLLCQKGDNLAGWSWIESDQLIGKAVRYETDKEYKTIAKLARPLINRLSLSLLSGWISLRESLGTLKSLFAGNRKLPLLSRIDKRLGEVIGKAFIFI